MIVIPSRLASGSTRPPRMVESCWCPVARKPTTLRRFFNVFVEQGNFDDNAHAQVCLNAPACERAWIYERALGYMLEGHDDRVIGEVTKKKESRKSSVNFPNSMKGDFSHCLRGALPAGDRLPLCQRRVLSVRPGVPFVEGESEAKKLFSC